MSDNYVDRRDFLKGVSALSAGLGAAAMMSGCEDPAKFSAVDRDQGGRIERSSTKPNVIFILADDLGYGDISYFGNPVVHTQALDALASEGICLTQHYAGAPICAPSRACLMTGMYPDRTGVLMSHVWHGMCPRMTTVAELFSQGGYRTGLVGKWHLEGGEGYSDQTANWPLKMGFEESVHSPPLSDYWNWTLHYGDKQVKSDGRYFTDVFTDEAVDFIHRHQSEPFFLYLAYTAPHFPLQPRGEDAEFYRQMGTLTEGQVVTYGLVRRLDYGVGRVMDTLKKLGLDDNTLIVFASDNGPFLSPWEGVNQERFNWNMRGAKGNMLEGGIRVPGIVRWPAGLGTQPRVCNDLIHFVDWMPTLLAAASLEVPSELEIDGVNVWPAIRKERHQLNTKRFWSWNWSGPRTDANTAMRDGDWKAYRPFQVPQSGYSPDPPVPEDQMPPALPMELYNVAIDPFEGNNLAHLYPDRVRRMEREIERWFADVQKDFRKNSMW